MNANSSPADVVVAETEAEAIGPHDDDLSALLHLVALASGAAGVLLWSDLVPGRDTVVGSAPSAFPARSQHLAPELLDLAGRGPMPTADLPLPLAVVSWLRFRPAFISVLRVPPERDSRFLFFFWRNSPSLAPAVLEAHERSIRLVASFAERHAMSDRMKHLQERLDAVVDNVSLGLVFLDLGERSLLSPLAAQWLNLPPTVRDPAVVVAAMQSARAQCIVEVVDDGPLGRPDDPDSQASAAESSHTEYWVWKARGLVLRVESHPMKTQDPAGRFWVFTDVKPFWDSTEKLKEANVVLVRNIAMLSEEMDRRMEAEMHLRQYSQGLRKENIQLVFGKLKSDQLANQDVLTGLANARKFRNDLEEMLDEARQRGDQVAVIYIDLDKFKEVNDTLGHERGDHLLCSVARAMVKALRKGDLAARMGGDEFTCAIRMNRGQGQTEIAATAKRLSSALNIAVEGPGRTIQVSATIGLAVFPGDAADSVTLLRAADNAMYVGKRSGGKEVVFFGERDPAELPPSPGSPAAPDLLPGAPMLESRNP